VSGSLSLAARHAGMPECGDAARAIYKPLNFSKEIAHVRRQSS
jgi:hypothetical protein